MRHRLIVLCATALAVALAGCRGSDDNQGLAEGSYDNPRTNTGAGDVGPGAPPVDAAGPAAGATAPATAPAPTLVLVQQGPQAPYVANGGGNALYYVDGDRDGGKCTGDCVQAWPPVVADGMQPSGGPGLQGAAIATVTRADGTRQVTFEGHPLYRYAADAGAGATNGDGVKDKFGSWHLAKPTGGSTAANAAPAASGAKGTTAAATGGSTPPGG